MHFILGLASIHGALLARGKYILDYINTFPAMVGPITAVENEAGPTGGFHRSKNVLIIKNILHNTFNTLIVKIKEIIFIYF